MKFVIQITINEVAQNAPGGPDMANIFKWTLHRYGGTDEGQVNPSENAGPAIATGTAAGVDAAKNTAEVYAQFYALETVYVYETPPLP